MKIITETKVFLQIFQDPVEILNENNVDLKYSDDLYCITMKVGVVEKSKKTRNYSIEEDSKKQTEQIFFIRIEYDVRFIKLPEMVDQDGNDISGSISIQELEDLLFREKCMELLNTYFLALFIAKPDLLITGETILLYEGKKASYDNVICQEGNLFTFEDYKPGRIELKTVFDFINSGDIFEDGRSKSTIGIGIAAIAIMYSYNSEDLQKMMLALMALEAIYTESNQSISSQLADKIPLFLNDIEIDSGKIKKIYDTRSRYIHGDFNIRIPFITNDDDMKKEDLLSGYYSYAMYLLILTIQKAIIENKLEIKYRYIIE